MSTLTGSLVCSGGGLADSSRKHFLGCVDSYNSNISRRNFVKRTQERASKQTTCYDAVYFSWSSRESYLCGQLTLGALGAQISSGGRLPLWAAAVW